MSVANSSGPAPLTVEGMGSEETPAAPMAANPPFINDRRDIFPSIYGSPYSHRICAVPVLACHPEAGKPLAGSKFQIPDSRFWG